MGVAFTDELQAEALSVQEQTPVQGGAYRWGWGAKRGPLLPAKGSREREWILRQYDHHDYNGIFRGARDGLIARVQSTPWEIVAKDADRWQKMLMQADFGDWDRFVSKVIRDYTRHDSGGWVELIAPGDPRGVPTGPVVGMAVLDSLRVFPTGNPTFPAIYYDIHGRMHLMHRARVMQIVDSPESEENLEGYGECALSRCIAAVHREILMNRYIEQFLDDKPPPGLAIFGNLSQPEVESALRRMEIENKTDDMSDWGRVATLYGLQAELKPTVEFVTYTKAPEGFDFEKYTTLNVKQIALGLGVDILDIWELTSASLGTGTQSQIMAQKSRGKALGVLLKKFERMINQALPDSAEFRWQYRDPQEDQEEATKAQTWGGTVQIISNNLTPDEQRQLLANQVPGLAEVLIDEKGELRRLPDDDPKGPSQDANATVTASDTQTGDDTTVLSALTQRAFGTTAAEFERRFSNFVRVGQAHEFPQAVMRSTFRDELMSAGMKAYEDGLEDGGALPSDADAVELAARRRKVAEWLALQNPYITSFVAQVERGEISRDQIPMRGGMWVNKSLRSIYYVGLNDAARERYFMWQLGATIAHCQTCLTLNGQVHKLKHWLKSGWTPQCTCLECKGFQCDCKFVAAEGPSRGRLPNSGGFLSGLVDRFTGFLQGKAGKELVADPFTATLSGYLVSHAEVA